MRICTPRRRSSASGRPLQPKGGKSEPTGWGRSEAEVLVPAALVQPKLKPPPQLPPSSLLASWLPGCTEEQICGVDGFQAQSSIIHKESSPGTHRTLGSLTLSKRKRWRPPKGSAKVTRQILSPLPTPELCSGSCSIPRFLCDLEKQQQTVLRALGAGPLPSLWFGTESAWAVPGRLLNLLGCRRGCRAWRAWVQAGSPQSPGCG